MQNTIRARMERPMRRGPARADRSQDREPSQDQWLPGAAAVPVDGHPDVVPFLSTAIGTCGTISA